MLKYTSTQLSQQRINETIKINFLYNVLKNIHKIDWRELISKLAQSSELVITQTVDKVYANSTFLDYRKVRNIYFHLHVFYRYFINFFYDFFISLL